MKKITILHPNTSRFSKIQQAFENHGLEITLLEAKQLWTLHSQNISAQLIKNYEWDAAVWQWNQRATGSIWSGLINLPDSEKEIMDILRQYWELEG